MALKLIKKHAVFLSALSITALLFLAHIVDSSIIIVESVDSFNMGNISVLSQVEHVETGRFTSYIKGYCFDASKTYDFYNFGLNKHGKGIYVNTKTALVKDEKVYLLPTVPLLREKLLSLPDAAALKGVFDYNFYVGTGSKFYNILMPKGEYQIAFVYESYENERYLILADERWWHT